MFKKTMSFILSVMLFATVAIGCAKPVPKYEGEEAITDKNMEFGLGLLGTNSLRDGSTIYKNIRYEGDYAVDSSVPPLWRLGQWGTKFDMSKTFEESMDGSEYTLKDNTKEFIVDPTTGQYSLNCYASAEYPEPKKFGEEWLHFITIQNMVDVATNLGDLENCYVNLDLEITFCENLMGNSFDPGLHTALFQWVFVIRNSNPNSPDFNQYIWLNIPYFDPRYPQFKEEAFLDYGKEDKSDTFIYMAASDGYLPKDGIEIGKRENITIDLIPYAQRAIDVISTLGANVDSEHPMLLNTTLEDMVIQQFYIGWEVPGTFNAGATIYNNSLLYNFKK